MGIQKRNRNFAALTNVGAFLKGEKYDSDIREAIAI